MGISIHYSGRITDKNKLPQLIEEVEEISKTHNWKYHIFDSVFPENGTPDDSSEHDGNLYGISFSPEGSEPVSFCFLSNGKMSSIMQLAAWGNYGEDQQYHVITQSIDADNQISTTENDVVLDKNEYRKMLYMCSTKTQFAGAAAHEMIITVIRYISGKYLSDFKLNDETEFWETCDKHKLEKSFGRLNFLLDGFAEMLEDEKRLPDEDVESFIKRITGKMKDTLTDNSDKVDNNET